MVFAINGRFLTQRISGVQRFAIEIVRSLHEQQNEILILCPPDISAKTQNEFMDWNIQVIGTQKGHLWEQVDLPRYLLKNGRPILLNLCNTGPLFYPNQIVTVHDVCFAKHKEWYSSSFRLFYNFLVPKLLKKAWAVLTVSEFSKNEIHAFFKVPRTKIHVIPNAISPIFLHAYSLGEKEKIILTVGSIDPRKNQRVLIEAFEKLNLNDWTLYLVGAEHQAFSGSHTATVHSPNIRWTGYLNDEELISLFRRAYCFVYPSLYEGFGIPPLEAMAVGCPTLVSDIPALRETCGNASQFFDPMNPEELAVKLKTLIENPFLAHSLVKEGKINVTKYSWNASAQKINHLLLAFRMRSTPESMIKKKNETDNTI